MSDQFQDIESCLAKLRPSRTDDDFLARLELAANGRLTTLSPEEERFGLALAASKPSALDPDYLKSLEQVVSGAPFALDEKILLFTQGSQNKGKNEARRKKFFRPWAAAAAAAVVGGLSALYVPDKPGSATVVSLGGLKSSPSIKSGAEGVTPIGTSFNFVPSGYQRNMQNAVDLGVVWVKDRPHRLFRVIYKDQADFTCVEGKRLEIEQSQVEHLLIPEKMD